MKTSPFSKYLLLIKCVWYGTWKFTTIPEMSWWCLTYCSNSEMVIRIELWRKRVLCEFKVYTENSYIPGCIFSNLGRRILLFSNSVVSWFFFFFQSFWVSEWVKSLSHVRLFVTPWTVAHQAPPSMGFSRKSTGVGCHFVLQGIFLTQGLNPGLPHCRQTFYHLSHHGSL